MALQDQLAKIDQDRSVLKAQLAALSEQESALRKHLCLSCKRCSGMQEIGDTNAIQSHWYESPHGCTGGDTWHMGDVCYNCKQCNSRQVIPKEYASYEFMPLYTSVEQEYER